MGRRISPRSRGVDGHRRPLIRLPINLILETTQ